MSAPRVRPAFADVPSGTSTGCSGAWRTLTDDRGLAEDLTSATFEALRERTRYDPGRATPMVWLLEVARRLALDHFRKDGRRRDGHVCPVLNHLCRASHTVVPPGAIRAGGGRGRASIGPMGRLRIDRLTGPPAPLRCDGAIVARRCHRASSPLARLVGLLATPDLGDDEALWLPRCGAVHALGLRAPVGCAFLDGAGRVLRVVDPLPPAGARARGARAVVECRAGVLAAVRPGQVLRRDEIAATSEFLVTGGG